MPRKAAVFDLDGTLLDTMQDISEAVNAVLESQGLPTHDQAACQKFVGDGVIKLFERALPQHADDNANADNANNAREIVDRCVRLFKHEYGKRWSVHSRPYPGITEMLDRLTACRIRLGVLSNKPHTFSTQCVEHLLPDWQFDAVYGQREGTPRKPDPAGLLQILEQWNIRPEECIFVGDSTVDMQTAVAAGVCAVGVSWGFQPVAGLWEHGAQLVVDHPDQISSLFDD